MTSKGLKRSGHLAEEIGVYMISRKLSKHTIELTAREITLILISIQEIEDLKISDNLKIELSALTDKLSDHRAEIYSKNYTGVNYE